MKKEKKNRVSGHCTAVMSVVLTTLAETVAGPKSRAEAQVHIKAH